MHKCLDQPTALLSTVQQSLLKRNHAAAPFVLGSIQGEVGGALPPLDVLRVSRKGRMADARGCRQLKAVCWNCLLESAGQPIGQGRCALRGVGATQQDGELVTAEAADQIVMPCGHP